MNFFITVNNHEIEAIKGETILQALKRAGIRVPTLCNMEGFTPTGACRLCMVEVKGRDELVPSCSQPVEEWMEIMTHTPRVIKARRMIVELLLADHPDDCLYCERNTNCELQRLAYELNVRERKQSSRKKMMTKDLSSPAITRDPSKCILCGRCVRVCEEIIGCSALEFAGKGDISRIDTLGGQGLNTSSCIACGQCIMVCPTSALYEKKHLAELQIALGNPKLYPVAIVDPVVSVSLSDLYGSRNPRLVGRQLNTLLKRCGIKEVYNLGLLQDTYVKMVTDEVISRGTKTTLSSNCPGWIKYAEQYMPETLETISKVKSPSQLAGSFIKQLSPQKNGRKVVLISFTPCTARKFESRRKEFNPLNGTNIDLVITARTLDQYIHLNGMDLSNTDSEEFDKPYIISSMYGEVGGVSGGTMEAIAAATYYKLNNEKELPADLVKKGRGAKSVKEISFKANGETWRFVAISGMAEAAEFLKEAAKKPGYYKYIEIMACPGGCINGGGVPIASDSNSIKNRQKQTFDVAEKNVISSIFKNRGVDDLLDIINKLPGKEALLYTSYNPRITD